MHVANLMQKWHTNDAEVAWPYTVQSVGERDREYTFQNGLTVAFREYKNPRESRGWTIVINHPDEDTMRFVPYYNNDINMRLIIRDIENTLTKWDHITALGIEHIIENRMPTFDGFKLEN